MNFGNILNVFKNKPATLAQRVEAVPMPAPGSYLEYRSGVKPRPITPRPVTPAVPQTTGGVTTSATVNLNPGITGERAPSRRVISVEEAQRRGTQLANRQVHSVGNEVSQIMKIIPGVKQPVRTIPSQATTTGRDAVTMRQQQIVGPAGYIPRVIQNHPGEVDDLGYGLINKQVR